METHLPPVTLPQPGGCACGAVRYALTGAPLLVYACHCHRCQSRSGAAFTLNMVIRSADIVLTGAVAERDLARSDRRIRQSWCSACGVTLSAVALAAPDYATLPAGTLDDAGWVRPIAQTCVESAILWAVIPGVAALAWEDFDFVEQGRLWQARAPVFKQA
jgi:hypothetical protein